MKEHEKSFCRARVAFEENRKLKGDEQEESNSGEHSPVSVSPPPSSTQEAVSTHIFVQFLKTPCVRDPRTAWSTNCALSFDHFD